MFCPIPCSLDNHPLLNHYRCIASNSFGVNTETRITIWYEHRYKCDKRDAEHVVEETAEIADHCFTVANDQIRINDDEDEKDIKKARHN